MARGSGTILMPYMSSPLLPLSMTEPSAAATWNQLPSAQAWAQLAKQTLELCEQVILRAK